jgi:3'(2'), 5'-bisphosphate nucleotidase
MREVAMNCTPSDEFDRLAEAFAGLAARAGAIAMEVFDAPRIESRLKTDASPVSEADERIEAFLLERLPQLAPGVPIVAEEAASRGALPAGAARFLLVDPLDGTREFLAHGRDFTVNIALVVDGEPKAGAVFAPALGEMWLGGEHAFATRVEPGAPQLPPRGEWRPLRARSMPPEGPVALVSRAHLDDATRAFLQERPITEIREVGSSVKFCRLADGSADVYPRFGPTMEWDTAAGDAVLRAAGGVVLDPESGPLRYGKIEARYLNGSFVAWADPAAAATLS